MQTRNLYMYASCPFLKKSKLERIRRVKFVNRIYIGKGKSTFLKDWFSANVKTKTKTLFSTDIARVAFFFIGRPDHKERNNDDVRSSSSYRGFGRGNTL